MRRIARGRPLISLQRPTLIGPLYVRKPDKSLYAMDEILLRESRKESVLIASL